MLRNDERKPKKPKKNKERSKQSQTQRNYRGAGKEKKKTSYVAGTMTAFFRLRSALLVMSIQKKKKLRTPLLSFTQHHPSGSVHCLDSCKHVLDCSEVGAVMFCHLLK